MPTDSIINLGNCCVRTLVSICSGPTDLNLKMLTVVRCAKCKPSNTEGKLIADSFYVINRTFNNILSIKCYPLYQINCLSTKRKVSVSTKRLNITSTFYADPNTQYNTKKKNGTIKKNLDHIVLYCTIQQKLLKLVTFSIYSKTKNPFFLYSLYTFAKIPKYTSFKFK